jgi:transcriptional regulator GlxA family with amidase domain
VICDTDVDGLFQLIADADWRLAQLLSYLKSDLSKPLSLSVAATLCRLERTYFSKYFRMHTGMTFVDWYRWVRIERAKALLAKPRMKVDAVSDAVGYRNITTFERAFRKCTGLCPAEYKKRIRSQTQKSLTTAPETATALQQTVRVPSSLAVARSRRSD